VWKVIGSSVVGNSHTKVGRGCDDSYGWRRTSQSICLVVADGAGSEEHSAKGSHAAVTAVLDWAHRYSIDLDEEKGLRRCFEEARSALKGVAERDHIPLHSLATTLGVAFVTNKAIKIGQIGDTIVVIRKTNGSYLTVKPPEKFEYVNEAVFLTSDIAFDYFREDAFDSNEVEAIAASTDGLRFKIASDLATYEPYVPFFEDLFAFTAKPNSKRDAIEKFLIEIEDQSGDDKTLLVAVRVEPAADLELTLTEDYVEIGPSLPEPPIPDE
jgi:sporulation protein YlmC with PRC-barrel domain